MNQQTLELLRALQSSERNSTAFAQIRVLLPQERTRLAAVDDRATLADISELLEVWAEATEPALAGVAALEAARIAEDDLEQAERAAQLYLLSIERSPIEGEALRRLDALLTRRGQHERLEAMLVAHVETLARTPNAPPEIIAARYRRLGQLRAERGASLDAAIEAYERSIDLAAEVDAIRELADLYGRRGNPADAAQAAELYCMLAELAPPEQGVPLLEQALDHAPANDAALDLLETYVSAGEQAARLERRWAAYIASSENEAGVDRRRMLLARAYAGQNRERDALICLGPLIEKSDTEALRMQASLLSTLQEHEQQSGALAATSKSGNGKAARPPTLVGFRMPEPSLQAAVAAAQKPAAQDLARKAEPKPQAEVAEPRGEDDTPIPSGEAVSVKQIRQSEGSSAKVKPARSGETLVGFRLPADGKSEGANGASPVAKQSAAAGVAAESQIRSKSDRATKAASSTQASEKRSDERQAAAKLRVEPERKPSAPAAKLSPAPAPAPAGLSAKRTLPAGSRPPAAVAPLAAAASKAAALKASRSSAPAAAAARPSSSIGSKSAELRRTAQNANAAPRISAAPPAVASVAAAAVVVPEPALAPPRAAALSAVPVVSPLPAAPSATARLEVDDEPPTQRTRPVVLEKKLWLGGIGVALVAGAGGLWLALRPHAALEQPAIISRNEAVVAAQPSPAAAPPVTAPLPPPEPVAPPPPVQEAPPPVAHEPAPAAHESTKSKKAPPAPRLASGKPHVKGGTLSASQISLVLEDALPGIERCYGDALSDKPKLKGKVVFGWNIEKNGKPAKIRVLNATLKDDAVQECSSDALRKLKFPKSKKTSEITWPLEYSYKKS